MRALRPLCLESPSGKKDYGNGYLGAFLGDGFACATFGAGSLESLVKSSSPGNMDLFGRAIAISADGMRLAVGAELEDSPSTEVGGPPIDGPTDSGGVHRRRLASPT